MRKQIILTFAAVFCWLVPQAELSAADVVQIEYYSQAGCDECRKVSGFILPRLEEQYSGQYELYCYDTGIPEHYLKLVAAQEKLKNLDNSPICMIIDGHTYLGGYQAIESSLFHVLEQSITQPPISTESSDADSNILQRRGEKFTLGAILLAGLVDGINPCVFATLIFFISLLAISHTKRRTLFCVGIVYCIACFLTYFALGFGLFRFLRLLNSFQGVQSAIEWLLIVVLLLFAIVSFGDAWRFKRTGKAKDVALQLPDSLKRRIHDVMKKGLKYRYLIPGAFVVGILVTAMESVCTGQVYVPTLVLLSREFGVGSRWFFYLLLYNIMFILPLLLIFWAAWRGVSVPAFIKWSKTHVVWSKIALGCFFLLLSALVFFLNFGGGL